MGYLWQLMEVIVVPLVILFLVIASTHGSNWTHAYFLLMCEWSAIGLPHIERRLLLSRLVL